MSFNLPPGVSDSDIPGNRPEDLRWEAFSDQEMNYAEDAIRMYGPDSEVWKSLKKTWVLVADEVGVDASWVEEVERDYEIGRIKERIVDNEQFFFYQRENWGREFPVEEVPSVRNTAVEMFNLMRQLQELEG